VKKYRVGYTQGVYDMFHIGHLNVLKRSKELCDKLIVGVNSDELVEAYKHKKPVIGEEERCEIVSNIKAVDECYIVGTLDKAAMHERFGFDAVFIGDDWKGSERWKKTEEELAALGAEVVYLPHTPGVSSTELRTEKDGKVAE